MAEKVPLTETEVRALKEAVFSGFEGDPEIELEWLDSQIESGRKQECQLVAAFRLNLELRRDAQMQQAAGELQTVRSAMAYMRQRRAVVAIEVESGRS